MTSDKVKALCVATRCANVDEFVSSFHRYCDADSFFVATLTMRSVGLETAFSIQLTDRTPILRGLCVVREAWSSGDNPFGRPGIWLGIKRLTRDSTEVFQKLRARRVNSHTGAFPTAPPPIETTLPVPPLSPPDPVLPPSAAPPPLPPMAFSKPRPKTMKIPSIGVRPRAITPAIAASASGEIDRTTEEADIDQPTSVGGEPEPDEPDAFDDQPTTAPRAPESTDVEAAPLPSAPERAHEWANQERLPGSEYVLPANPLMNLTDASLEGFIDCTLYEATAQFMIDEMTPFPRAPSVLLPAIDPPLPSPTGTMAAAAPPSSGFVVDEQGYVRSQTIPPPVAMLPAIEPPVDTIARTPLPTGQLVPFAAPQRFEPPSLESSFEPPPATPEPPPSTPIAEFDRRSAPAPMRTAREPRSRWWVIAPAAALAITLGIAVIVWSGSGSDAATKPDNAGTDRTTNPKPTGATDREATPATDPKPASADPQPSKLAPTAKNDVEDEPPPGNGPPVVGKGPCTISVVATPAGAQVQVDGDVVGPTPLSLRTTCQRHRIDLSHARYANALRFVAPAEGKPETLDVTLTRPTHSLTVTTQPPNATVSIDGRRAGTTPTVVSIMGFQSITLTVAKPGHKTVSKTIYSRRANDSVSITMPGSLFFGGKR